MAELEIAEYSYQTPARLSMPAGEEEELAFTLLTYTTSTQHTLNPMTRLVRLKARTARAYVKFGENPTATVDTSKSLEQNSAEYFSIQRGSGMKLAAYDGVS